MLHFIKKIVIIFLAFVSLAGSTHAQNQPQSISYISNIKITDVPSGVADETFPQLRFEVSKSNLLSAFPNIDNQDNISVFARRSSDNVEQNLGSFSPLPDAGSGSVNIAVDASAFLNSIPYNQLFIELYRVGQEDPVELQPLDISPFVAEYTSTTSTAASVNFPGWDIYKYCQIRDSGNYYPFVRSYSEQRTRIIKEPADAKLYLILENVATQERTFLQDGDYSNVGDRFNVSWPAGISSNSKDCDGVLAPLSGQLSPGVEYAVFLSESLDGSTGPVSYSGQDTYQKIGRVPGTAQPEAVVINDVTIIDDSYFQIKGSFASGFTDQVSFSFTGKNPDGTTGSRIPLGSTTGKVGEFTFPDTPRADPLGEFSSYTIEALVAGEVVATKNVIRSRQDPADTNNNSDSGLSGGPALNSTQQDIVRRGLVTTDCGYNIRTSANRDGAGRICGFYDAIGLVKRVIDYIFILALPILAIVFAYAGYLLLTSGGAEGKRTSAKNAMINAVTGIVVVMAAWLIVKTIVTSLGVSQGLTGILGI